MSGSVCLERTKHGIAISFLATLLLAGIVSGCSSDEEKKPAESADTSGAEGFDSCDNSVWFDGHRFSADAYLIEAEAGDVPANPKRGKPIGTAQSDCPGAEPESDAFALKRVSPDRAIWVESLGPVAADEGPSATAPTD